MIGWRSIRSAVALLACATSLWCPSLIMAQQVVGTPQFSLSRAPSPGHIVRIIGSDWTPSSRVTISVRYFALSAHRRLRVPASGSFGLQVNGVRWCKQLTIKARDQAGHQAVLRPHNHVTTCLAPVNGARIGIRVMSVHQSVHQSGQQEVTIDTRHLAVAYTMHVGDVLYVYSPGTTAPAFLPKTDSAYLQEIDHGTVPSCQPSTPCPFPQGFFWHFKALRAGTTYLDLSPACRQMTPPCGAPDRLVRVNIAP